MSTFIDEKLEQFDQRFLHKPTPGEYAFSIVRSPNIIQDTTELKDFLASALADQHTQLVREFVEDLNKAVHMAGVLRWGVEHHIDEVITKWSSLLPNNKEKHEEPR
jgi:hypothetical protein